MRCFGSALTGRLVCISLSFILLVKSTLSYGQSPMTLLDGLKKLNQKRGIYFLFDPKLVAGRTVSASLDWKGNAEDVLGQLLQGTNLSYRKVSDCYLIEAPMPQRAASSAAPSPVRKITISGYVRERNSGEQLAGATVFVAGLSGTSTNNYGYYSLSLPENEEVDLIISLVGYQRAYRRIRLNQPVQLNVELTNNDFLDEVVLRADANERAWSGAQTSQHNVPPVSVRNTPATGGEKDVLKTLQFLPGIQKGHLGQAGLNVRGGGPDQNLLILDEAPVYNANHLFGFFSAFNVDALKSIRLQKGGFSARYGGRLSSVVEMNMRDGNNQQLQGEAGTGIIASRMILEGPLVRDKSSFLLTARRTNFRSLLGNYIATYADNYNGTDWKAGFYDLNAKVNLTVNRHNQLYLSGYFGRDSFGGGDSLAVNRRRENGMNWGNATGTLRWNHLFGERLFSNMSFIFSQYDFSAYTKYRTTTAFAPNTTSNTWRYFNRLTDYTLKYDLDYFPALTHQIYAGLSSTQRFFRLNGFEVSDTLHARMHMEPVRSAETAVYAEDIWDISKRLKVIIGSRATLYQVNDASFLRFEPRVSASLKLSSRTALRGSYSEMNQFVHQLTNTGQGLPTDLWVPALAGVKPQRSRQAVLDLVYDLTSRWQISIEVYRKWMSHIIGYHPDAGFISLTNAQAAEGIRWERNVTSGYADASGLDVMIERKTGRLSGWVSYSWAITRRRFPALNNGQAFFPAHDRRHTLSWIGSYTLKPNLKLSASWTYGSGTPRTTPVTGTSGSGKLSVKGSSASSGYDPLPAQGDSLINARNVPLHQLDVSLQKTLSAKRLTHLFEITVTNAYANRNAFYSAIPVNTGETAGIRGIPWFTLLPSISYTLRF